MQGNGRGSGPDGAGGRDSESGSGPGPGSGSGDGNDNGTGNRDGTGSDPDPVVELATREGWRAEGYAARVHYSGGGGSNYSVEYYAPSEAVLYWAVDDAGSAVPVPRSTVPDPLRDRIREDLKAAGIDPALEREEL